MTPTFDQFLQQKGVSTGATAAMPSGTTSDQEGMTSLGVPYQDLQKTFFAAGLKNPKQASNLKSILEIVKPTTETAAGKKTAEAQKLKQDVVQIGTQLQNVIKNKASYDPETYKTIVDSLTSTLTIKQKEAANFGASLTGNELALLAGQLPVRQEIGMSAGGAINQFFTGQKPVQTGRVVDTEEEMLRKLSVLIPGLQGQTITPEMMGNVTPSGQTDKSVGGLLKNAGGELKDILNTILGLPAQAAGLQKQYGSMGQSLISGQGPAREILLQGSFPYIPAVQEANQFLGEPLKGGDIAGRAIDRAYEKPLQTLGDIMLARGAVKGIKGNLKAPTTPKTPAVPPVSPTGSPLTQLIESVKGRAATAVAQDLTKTVAENESIMQKVLQMSKENTTRGIAKRMHAIPSETGKVVESAVKRLDKIVGPQPLNEVVSDVMTKLGSTSEVLGDPKLSVTMERLLSRLLKTKEKLPGGYERGEMFTTNLERIDATRKFLNKGLQSWYQQGKPAGTVTNDLNALKSKVSRLLGDMEAEADPTGTLKETIGLEHIALEAEPFLSKTALSSLGQSGLWGRLFNLFSKLTEPGRVFVGRKLQGENPRINQLMSGEPLSNIPNIQQPAPQTMGPLLNTQQYMNTMPQFPSQKTKAFQYYLGATKGINKKTGLPIGGRLYKRGVNY